MSGMMSNRGRRKLRAERDRLESEAEDEGGGEINLVPYLDIVTNVLMFLIMTVQQVLAVGNLEIMLPEYGEGGGGAAKQEKPPLNLTVTITEKGFTLATSAGVMHGGGVAGNPTVPMVADQKGPKYDYKGLQAKLVELKRNNQKEDQAILSANPDVPYEAIIGVMDVLRAGPDLKPLFPQVLFSTGLQ